MGPRSLLDPRARTPLAHVGADAAGAASFFLLFDEPPVVARASRPASPAGPSLLVQLLAAEHAMARREIVAGMLRELGFAGLTYGRMGMVRGEPAPTAFCVAHGDGDWVRRYFARRYHVIDPRLASALRSTLPCWWSVKGMLAGAEPGRRGDELRQFAQALVSADMFAGVIFAMPGPGAQECSVVSLTTCNDSSMPTSDAQIARIVMLSMCMHEFYTRYVHWPREEPGPASTLSERQNQILQGLARGLTDREIAQALDLTMHGVDYHLRRLRERFGARNRVELVQAAYRSRSC